MVRWFVDSCYDKQTRELAETARRQHVQSLMALLFGVLFVSKDHHVALGESRIGFEGVSRGISEADQES